MTTPEALQKYRDNEAARADERQRAVIDALQAGKTYRAIAAEFGISFQRVGHIAARARKRGLLGSTGA